jgi:hypothetical protein
LAPYLFLIIAEVLNAMVRKEVDDRLVKGIELPVENRQQVMLQYAYDTSFTLQGEEASVRRLVLILESFCLASGLKLNWAKSSAFWKGGTGAIRPTWTNSINVSWAENTELTFGGSVWARPGCLGC